MRFKRTNMQHPIGHWWWTIDRYLLATLFLLMAVGLVLVMSASPPVAERIGLSSYHFVRRQTVFILIAAVLIVAISMLKPVTIRRGAFIGLAVCIGLLLAVHLTGTEIKGAKRWLYIGSFSLQPSEFLKPLFAVCNAWLLARKSMDQGFPSYIFSTMLFALIAGFLVLQPDIGMTISFAVIWGGQLFLAGLSWIPIAVCMAAGVIGLVLAYEYLPHVHNRINVFLDPASGDNYQVEKSLEAVAQGGLLGRGPGEGVIKEIIPDAHTDFIFAVAGEEFGLLLSLAIVALYGFFIVRGTMRIYRIEDVYVVLAASGLFILFAIQAIINMGVSLSLLPNKGMTLPLISYGGSSTMAVAIAAGMILAFTRRRYGMVSLRRPAIG